MRERKACSEKENERNGWAFALIIMGMFVVVFAFVAPLFGFYGGSVPLDPEEARISFNITWSIIGICMTIIGICAFLTSCKFKQIIRIRQK